MKRAAKMKSFGRWTHQLSRRLPHSDATRPRPISLPASMAIGIMLLMMTGCGTTARLTPGTVAQKYPYDQKVLSVAQVEVFRKGSNIELFNQSTRSYSDFDLWLNERYVRRIQSLPLGGSLTLSLYEFIDEFGEPFRGGGGFFTAYIPEPVIKAEMETPKGLVGFIVIPDESAP